MLQENTVIFFSVYVLVFRKVASKWNKDLMF